MIRLRPIIAALVLLPSLIVLAWGLWPAPSQPHILRLNPAQLVPNAAGSSGAPPPSAFLGPRLLLLEYPASIPAGDSAVIRLTLSPSLQSAETATSDGSGSPAMGASAQPAQSQQAQGWIAEADLDLEGAAFKPGGPVREPFLPDQPAAFRWSVHPPGRGSYSGTMWSFLVFTDAASGTETRYALAAQPVQFQAETLLGLGGQSARLVGLAGSAAGVLLLLPLIEALMRRAINRPQPRT